MSDQDSRTLASRDVVRTSGGSDVILCDVSLKVFLEVCEIKGVQLELSYRLLSLFEANPHRVMLNGLSDQMNPWSPSHD